MAKRKKNIRRTIPILSEPVPEGIEQSFMDPGETITVKTEVKKEAVYKVIGYRDRYRRQGYHNRETFGIVKNHYGRKSF